MYKKCAMCHQDKPKIDFTPIKGGKYVYSYCKKCACLKQKKYYAEHADKKALISQRKLIYAKKYREDNKEKIRAYYKLWYQKTNRYRPRKTVSE